MAAMAMEALATDTARGPLTLRPSLMPMPTSDMVDSTATDLVLAMAVMAMVLVWAMAMAVLAMAVLATAMARGQLMPSPRPMPGSDMAASTATDSQPMAVTATDCGARSKQNQIPRLTISYNTPNDLTGLYKHP